MSDGETRELIDRGIALLRSEDVEGAIAEFEKAVESDPGSADARYELANAMYENGDDDAAFAGWRKTLELNPDYLFAIENLAMALDEAGGTDETAELWRRALALETRPEWIEIIREKLGK